MARYDDNGFIIELDDNEVFIFGSNLAGRHGKGAAKTALNKFGAIYGVGEGPQGQSYAFPTLDWNLNQLSTERLKTSSALLFAVTQCWYWKKFYLTDVGCGLGGYSPEYMKQFFTKLPSNVTKPEGW